MRLVSPTELIKKHTRGAHSVDHYTQQRPSQDKVHGQKNIWQCKANSQYLTPLEKAPTRGQISLNSCRLIVFLLLISAVVGCRESGLSWVKCPVPLEMVLSMGLPQFLHRVLT